MRIHVWVLLAGLGLLVASCGGSDGQSGVTDTLGGGDGGGGGADTASAPDSGAADTDDPALSAETAALLQRVLDEHVAFSADPGVTAAVRTPAGAWWTGSAGAADLSDDSPMAPDQRFRAGSNTKPIVAAAVLQLVEEGYISLDAPLTDYLPDYDDWSDVTVRMLLNMRSGIPDFLANTTFMLGALAAPNEPVTPEAVVEAGRAQGMNFEPGTDGAYTNTSYVLLGLIIEAVTGNDALDEIEERILVPLGMEDSYFDRGRGLGRATGPGLHRLRRGRSRAGRVARQRGPAPAGRRDGRRDDRWDEHDPPERDVDGRRPRDDLPRRGDLRRRPDDRPPRERGHARRDDDDRARPAVQGADGVRSRHSGLRGRPWPQDRSRGPQLRLPGRDLPAPRGRRHGRPHAQPAHRPVRRHARRARVRGYRRDRDDAGRLPAADRSLPGARRRGLPPLRLPRRREPGGDGVRPARLGLPAPDDLRRPRSRCPASTRPPSATRTTATSRSRPPAW